jgi:hypothetical protein
MNITHTVHHYIVLDSHQIAWVFGFAVAFKVICVLLNRFVKSK